MAGYRKLGRTSSQRKALLRGQVTSLLYHGKIVTTEAKAKEIRKIAEGLIAMAVREKDNFDEVTVTAKVARKDKAGIQGIETPDQPDFLKFSYYIFYQICLHYYTLPYLQLVCTAR